MPAAPQEPDPTIDCAMAHWRQGDVCLDAGLEFIHLVDLSRKGSIVAAHAAQQLQQTGEPIPTGASPVTDSVPGFVVLTQTCDIVRPNAQRPYLEVSPLIRVSVAFVEEVRRLRRPAFAYVPAVAERQLVADLDRVMTVEKNVVAGWHRVPGWHTDDQARAFAEALARKCSRFAFPDDFVAMISRLQQRLRRRHDRQHPEGAHLRALREIRVRAAPSWDDDQVNLGFWFIKDDDPPGPAWADLVDEWMALLDAARRFRVEFAVACRLEDIAAKDYIESDRLDLDSLSGPAVSDG